MKHIHPFLLSCSFLLSFFLLLMPSEYYHTPYDTQHMVINFNFEQSSTETVLHTHLRNQYINNIVRQHKWSDALHQKTITNNAPININDTSTFDKRTLSTGMKSYRNKIFELFMDNDPEIQRSYFEKYTISPLAQHYFNNHNINASSFEACSGNMLQHIIHQELLILTDATAHLWNRKCANKEIRDLTAIIGNFIDAGVYFNQEKELKKASALADAGWALFDCIFAAGEGVIDGLSAVAHDITHPIQTIQNFATAITSCGYYIATALQEIGITTRDIISGNFDAAYNKYELWSEQCKIISQTLGVIKSVS